MSESVPTVEIVNPDNAEEMVIINTSDFDPEKHTLWAEKDKPRVPRKEEKASPPSPPERTYGDKRGRDER